MKLAPVCEKWLRSYPQPRAVPMRATAIRNDKPVISERTFQAQVMKLARYYKWRAAHFRAALTRRGNWVTAMSGDIGFPDCVLVRNGRIIFAELKTDTGKTTVDQQRWLEDIGEACWVNDNVSVFVWRPKDYDAITEILK